MSNIHQIVALHGRDKARGMVPLEQRHLVDIAAEILADDERALGITYSGFCLTSFPHRRLPDDAVWRRDGHNVTLMIDPGRMPQLKGEPRLVGVPYGARARMILLYLQTQAVRTGSREVELGRSMRGWMTRMGVPYGGESAKALRDQAQRISVCRIQLFWNVTDEAGRRGNGFTNGGIVKTGLFFGNGHQDSFFNDSVLLDESFYEALRDHSVPLSEAAIRVLKEKSLSLDLYVWLAYRLHSLTACTRLSWMAVAAQFGAGFKRPRAFRAYFVEALSAALAAYPYARVDVEEEGLVLHPSRPPIARLSA